jgi:hypothetical protein
MTISCCFRNSPLVSFWSGLVEGAPCRRESRLKAAPTARYFAMIGYTVPIAPSSWRDRDWHCDDRQTMFMVMLVHSKEERENEKSSIINRIGHLFIADPSDLARLKYGGRIH